MNLNIYQLVLYFSVLELTSGFKCYKCSYAYFVENSRQECIDDPDSLGFNDRLECNSTSYCVLMEQYDIGKQVVTSYFRSCAAKAFGNACQKDWTHVTCYASCQGDFCNRHNKGNLSEEFLAKHHDNGPCLEKLAVVDARQQASNGTLLGLERPNCADDGFYAGMQFAGPQAYCVTKNGTSIPSYSVNRWETGKDMNCQCARDLYDYTQSGLIGKLFRCEPNGDYANTQCMGDICYCVDSTGNMVGTSKVEITQLGSLNC